MLRVVVMRGADDDTRRVVFDVPVAEQLRQEPKPLPPGRIVAAYLIDRERLAQFENAVPRLIEESALADY